MVECGGLENRLAGIPRYEGSNPSLSASRMRRKAADEAAFLRAGSALRKVGVWTGINLLTALQMTGYSL